MAKYSVFLFVIFLLKMVYAIQFGSYSNNDKPDTIVEQLNPIRMTNVEKGILNLFDISEKPKLNAERSILNSSASHYMKELYNFTVYSQPTKYFNIEQNRRTIEESDIVITFLIEDDDNVIDDKYDIGKKLLFNVSKIPVNNIILKVQLHLYKQSTNNSGNITVSLDQIYSDDNGEQTKSSIDELNIFHSYEGWLTFNITEVFAGWSIFSSLKELFVSVRELQNSDRKIRPESVGIIFTSSLDKKNNWQPFVTAFVKNGAKKSNSIIRRKRSANSIIRRKRSANFIKRRKRSDIEPPTTIFNSDPSIDFPTSSELENGCQKRSLYVDFSLLSWDDWIILPSGFSAYDCSGSCDYPYNLYVDVTNHSILQSLVHLVNETIAPELNCAPSILSPLPILYLGDNTSVHLSECENMIVAQCGCF